MPYPVTSSTIHNALRAPADLLTTDPRTGRHPAAACLAITSRPSCRRWLTNALHFAIGLAVGAFLAAPVLEWFVEGMPQ